MNDQDDKKWDVRLKVWFEVDGHPVIGDGRLDMLNMIHQKGSIIEAARAMGISYRKIRGAINDMEKCVGQSLVNAYRGGDHGGGANLTPAAHELIKTYTKVKDDFQQKAGLLFQSDLYKNLPPNGIICHSVTEGG